MEALETREKIEEAVEGHERPIKTPHRPIDCRPGAGTTAYRINTRDVLGALPHDPSLLTLSEKGSAEE
jgi:hypothetical protein